MTKEMQKQFFLIHTTGTDDIDYGVIEMTEEEKDQLIKGKDRGVSEYIDRELGIGNFESWVRADCSKTNVETFLYIAAAMIKEIEPNDYSEIVGYCIDIIIKAKDLNEEDRRNLLEEVGAIAKNW